jgi:hypothetical protein
MRRHVTRILAAASLTALGAVGIAGTASALPIKDVLGQPPTVVIVDPPPPTTVPPVTLPPYTVPPTTVATPPTTSATPPPNTGNGNGNGGSNNTPAESNTSDASTLGQPGALSDTSTALAPLGTDTLAAAPVASETERGSSLLILVSAVLAAALASLGAGLFLRQHRRQA